MNIHSGISSNSSAISDRELGNCFEVKLLQTVNATRFIAQKSYYLGQKPVDQFRKTTVPKFNVKTNFMQIKQ
jgi:hypothetical protein